MAAESSILRLEEVATPPRLVIQGPEEMPPQAQEGTKPRPIILQNSLSEMNEL